MYPAKYAAKAAAALVVIALAVSALGSSAFAQSIYDKVKAAGKIRLGVKNDYPPFASLDKNNTYVGFDIDLWKGFAKDLGVTIEYVPITSQSRIPLLTNGTIDAVSGGTTHTIARDAVVDYSITYFRTGQRFLVRKNSGIKGLADLAEPKTVAVVQGADSGPNFMKLQPKGKLVTFQEYPQAVLALKQGKVDALTTDEVLLDQFADSDLEVVGEYITNELYGMLMRQDDSKWRDWINVEIQKSWKNGTYQELYKKYFKKDPNYEIEIWQD
jgi:polar amino acid transport system substrate-binding protein